MSRNFIRRFTFICLMVIGLFAGAGAVIATPLARPLQTDRVVGTAECPTIQACIDLAKAGDRILIPAGKYVEHLQLRKGVSLIGAGAQVTLVRSDSGSWKTLTISAQSAPITASTVISGLTFTGGHSTTAGGGIGLQFPMSPTIQNVIITGNTADTGGGIGISAGASALLVNVVITGNVSTGAMGYGGSGLFMAGDTVTLINTLVADNVDGSARGQIEVMGGTAIVEYGTVANVTRSAAAGVVTTGGTAVLTNTIIAGHSTGINLMSGSVSEDYNLFYNNALDRNGFNGAGLHDWQADPQFVNPMAGNYHLLSISPARNRAIDLGITTDIDGDARPQTAYGSSGYDLGFDEFAATRSLPPVVCDLTETHGLTSNGGWQNTFNQPAFTWSPVNGAEGYKVIYHDTLTRVLTTTQPSIALPALVSGYAVDLFVEPHDLADPALNNAPGNCAFTVRYDNEAPVIPAAAVFSANFPNNVWTNTSVTPQITLNPINTSQSIHDGWFDPYSSPTCSAPAVFPHACESASGLKEERTYFGPDANGAPSTLWGPVQTWTLSPVASGVYFFRLAATDNLNQSTPVQTVRVLKLDTVSPTVVLTYTGSNPSVMNTSLPFRWSGVDTHSGIATYDVLVNGAVWLSNTTVLTATYPGACNSTYQIQVRAKDAAGNMGSSNTQSVSIVCDLVPPVITLSLPTANQIINGSSLAIAGTASDNSGLSKVEVSTNGGLNWSLATGTTSWSYVWSTPIEDGLSHLILARATDTANNTTTTTPITITVDRVLPQLSIDDPTLGQIIRTHAYAVTGSATDGSGLSKIEVSIDNGATFNAASLTKPWVWNWAIPDEDGVSHLVQGRATDRAGNVRTLSPAPIAVFVDNVPPVLSFANLTNGQAIYTTTYALRGLVTGAVSTTLQMNGTTQVLNGLTGAFTQTLHLITGTQTITATAFDAVGNVTIITATINVRPPSVSKIFLPLLARNFNPDVDRYEPDNVYSDAKSITADGALQRRNFYPADDVDWARLDVTPGTYILSTSGLSSNTDTVLRLYASNGVTQLALNDDCSLTTRASCLTWTVSAATTLYIQITPYNSQSIGSDRWYDLAVVKP